MVEIAFRSSGRVDSYQSTNMAKLETIRKGEDTYVIEAVASRATKHLRVDLASSEVSCSYIVVRLLSGGRAGCPLPMHVISHSEVSAKDLALARWKDVSE